MNWTTVSDVSMWSLIGVLAVLSCGAIGWTVGTLIRWVLDYNKSAEQVTDEVSQDEQGWDALQGYDRLTPVGKLRLFSDDLVDADDNVTSTLNDDDDEEEEDDDDFDDEDDDLDNEDEDDWDDMEDDLDDEDEDPDEEEEDLIEASDHTPWFTNQIREQQHRLCI